mmetsp:Transcript_78067/g.155150  ORF Transcript_78067/g.155150 Transcript_78067/m.155150 type:complete len:310 (-) Transcript_78067:1094-2023(-)
MIAMHPVYHLKSPPLFLSEMRLFLQSHCQCRLTAQQDPMLWWSVETFPRQSSRRPKFGVCALGYLCVVECLHVGLSHVHTVVNGHADDNHIIDGLENTQLEAEQDGAHEDIHHNQRDGEHRVKGHDRVERGERQDGQTEEKRHRDAGERLKDESAVQVVEAPCNVGGVHAGRHLTGGTAQHLLMPSAPELVQGDAVAVVSCNLLRETHGGVDASKDGLRAQWILWRPERAAGDVRRQRRGVLRDGGLLIESLRREAILSCHALVDEVDEDAVLVQVIVRLAKLAHGLVIVEEGHEEAGEVGLRHREGLA